MTSTRRVDKATDFVDDKTGGKTAGITEKVDSAVDSATDKLSGGDTPAPPYAQRQVPSPSGGRRSTAAAGGCRTRQAVASQVHDAAKYPTPYGASWRSNSGPGDRAANGTEHVGR